MFSYPIRDIESIDIPPMPYPDMLRLPRKDVNFKARLILTSQAHLRWILTVTHHGVLHGITGKTNQKEVRIFRKLNMISSVAKEFNLPAISIPIITPKYRLHRDYVARRQRWIVDFLASQKISTKLIAEKTNSPTVYVTRVIAGTLRHPDIEAFISEIVEMPVASLFPPIPDQFL